MRGSITVPLRQLVAAGATTDGGGAQVTFEIGWAARVRHLLVTLPPGSAGTLQLRPMLLWRGERVDLVNYAKGGYGYLSGDNNQFPLDTDVKAQQGAVLTVWYANLDAVNPHEYFCDVLLAPDTEGGA